VAVYLTSNAGSVSGIAIGPPAVNNLCTANGCCGTPIGVFDEALTGTVDADGNVDLVNAANAKASFALTGTVTGSAMTNGKFALSGACTAAGTATGTEYQPLDGTYSGTLMSQVTGQSFMVSAALDQSGAPNSSGYIGLTGMVDATGYSCVSSGGATSISLNTTYLGNNLNASLIPSSNEMLSLLGTLSPDGTTLGVSYSSNDGTGSCNDDYGTGTLTLQ